MRYYCLINLIVGIYVILNNEKVGFISLDVNLSKMVVIVTVLGTTILLFYCWKPVALATPWRVLHRLSIDLMSAIDTVHTNNNFFDIVSMCEHCKFYQLELTTLFDRLNVLMSDSRFVCS